MTESGGGGGTGAIRREVFGPGTESGLPPALFGEDLHWDRFLDRFPDPLAFIDIETCGLGDTVIFLAGVLRHDPPRPLVFDSIFAADPACEPVLLAAVAERLRGAAGLVTFNGKSFDMPRLRKRAFRHRIEWPASPHHVDLLHEVRRCWGGTLPDCRLGTVERRLLGLDRGPHDIPGREVPARYWDFVTTGSESLIEPVREHNRRDVLAMVALLDRLAAEDEKGRRDRGRPPTGTP